MEFKDISQIQGVKNLMSLGTSVQNSTQGDDCDGDFQGDAAGLDWSDTPSLVEPALC